MNERTDTNKTFGATTDRSYPPKSEEHYLEEEKLSANHRAWTRVRHLHGPESRQVPSWHFAHLTLVLALANHIKAKTHHCVTDLVNMEG